MDMSYSL